ncbi:lipopolysaccharide biosynthesis protein [Macrococcus capreoli]
MKILKNQKFIFALSSLIYSASNFLFVYILTRFMNPSIYGEYNTIIMYGTLLSLLLILGTDQVILRYYIRNNLKSLLNNFYIWYIVINLFLIIVIIFMNFYLNINSIIFGYLYANFVVIFRIINVIIRMQSDALGYSFYNLFSKLIELITILILIKFTFLSTNTAIIAYMFSVLLTSLIIINKVIKNIEYKKSELSIKEQFNYSVPMFGSIILTTLAQNIDKIILPLIISAHQIGIYFSAFKLTSTLLIFQSIFSIVWMPDIIRKFENKENLQLSKTLGSIQSILVILISILISFNNLLVGFLGKEYSEAKFILPILFLVPYFMMLAEIGSIGITLREKTHFHLIISLFYTLSNIIFILFLSYRFGLEGTAYGVVLSTILYYILRNYVGLLLLQEKIKFIKFEAINFLVFLLPFLYSTNFYYFIFIVLILNILILTNISWRLK